MSKPGCPLHAGNFMERDDVSGGEEREVRTIFQLT